MSYELFNSLQLLIILEVCVISVRNNTSRQKQVKNPAFASPFSLEKIERAMTQNGLFLGMKWMLKIPNDMFLAKKTG
jgi:hypothetical protein